MLSLSTKLILYDINSAKSAFKSMTIHPLFKTRWTKQFKFKVFYMIMRFCRNKNDLRVIRKLIFKLSNIFGINFSNLSRNMVLGNEFATGAVILSEENELFKSAKKAYLKEVSILEIKQPAKAVISKDNEVVMAVSKYGKGTVFSVGDPWLYNEYVDGTKIPAEYENFLAGTELAKWLVNQVKK